MQKLISLVGKPNTGKSTLFNRFSLSSRALTHNTVSTTRDRKYSDACLKDINFRIVDTPGIVSNQPNESLQLKMLEQTKLAIIESDLVFLVVDQNPITIVDHYISNFIRQCHKSCLLIVNKSEANFYHELDYYKLGGKEMVAISAKHGVGIIDIYQFLLEEWKDFLQSKTLVNTTITKNINIPIDTASDNIISLAVAGRPNVGKSTFINSILKQDRVITGEEMGTTRESIDIYHQHNGYKLKIIDTAGLKKRSSIRLNTLEQYSYQDSIKSINLSNIIILMLDSKVGIESQDCKIANYAASQGRGIVFLINKIDLISDKINYQKLFHNLLSDKLPQMKNYYVTFISAKKSQNIHEVFNTVIKAYENWNMRISTGKINNWIAKLLKKHPLPINKKIGRRVKIKYLTQNKTRPPSFKIFTNDPENITECYKKYLVSELIKDFKLYSTPIRLEFIKTNNPYV
ncbi:ribosome biogenesis GTPase Der [Rickettsia endosymbiont of Cardiosporidium cionae]|uniref:ribosome biogenesis GTPase Der n=1 Tax=Rickettsia endosymbiont of Cardiosporidium cionae TaxID=2777155 RepID=UPI0018945812|nr:ribosome biogenesis GTPase Der [Rickettsia endosymbiont of Cardiosporidium cionae]KAF8818617.1 ribosome biogenesis GTPase Der [Rickettsia endosymbiont of Cardiosporidium cionae]